MPTLFKKAAQPPPVAKDEVLVLHDSGAAPNIANHAKHFPGSTLVPSKDGDKFSTATGEPFGSNGEMSVNFESLEGHQKTFTFKNADVAIPILSTGLLTDDDHESTFRKKDGGLTHVPTIQTIKFFRMYGVYFFRFKVDKSILAPPPPVPDQDFRPGTQA